MQDNNIHYLDFSNLEYEINPRVEHSLLTIICGGKVDIPGLLRCSVPFTDCYMFIYTVKGQAQIVSPCADTELCDNSLILLPCNHDCFVQKLSDDWSFYIFILKDSYFCNLPFAVKPHSHSLFHFSESSNVIALLDQLCENRTGRDMSNKIIDHKLLTDLFCEAFLTVADDLTEVKQTPSYLIDMKNILDTQYMYQHSLEKFEDMFAISRYRLCREFSAEYGESPIQYLNKLRIQKSLQLLRDTELNIHETGIAVGIENTNHFINLFKKHIGRTPLAYRSMLSV